MLIRGRLILCLMILGVLCAPAFGQTTAIDWNDKGNVLVDQGKYDEAIKAYDKAIEINPQLAEVWNNKGLALYHQGKYSEAIQAYDRAIEINPQLAEAWYNKGNALKLLGRTTEADAAFAKAGELGDNGVE